LAGTTKDAGHSRGHSKGPPSRTLQVLVTRLFRRAGPIVLTAMAIVALIALVRYLLA
jgi:uncharacterized protein involved in exopolysaccharide biosynthesis